MFCRQNNSSGGYQSTISPPLPRRSLAKAGCRAGPGKGGHPSCSFHSHCPAMNARPYPGKSRLIAVNRASTTLPPGGRGVAASRQSAESLYACSPTSRRSLAKADVSRHSAATADASRHSAATADEGELSPKGRSNPNGFRQAPVKACQGWSRLVKGFREKNFSLP